jgi:hypothetical protein
MRKKNDIIFSYFFFSGGFVCLLFLAIEKKQVGFKG